MSYIKRKKLTLEIPLPMELKLTDKELKELITRLNQKLKKYEGHTLTINKLNQIIKEVIQEIYR